MHWLTTIAALLPLLTFAHAHAHKAPLGVQPHLAARYAPAAGDTWECLDGSARIPWKAVNDDYCDCKDGSDEPGTSACAGSTFYCANEGHMGAAISGSRVNDGLCGERLVFRVVQFVSAEWRWMRRTGVL